MSGLTGLALASCGGSSGSSATQTTPPAATTPAGATAATQPSSPPASSGTTPTTTTKQVNPTSPARAAFIRQADQICGAANTALVRPQNAVNAAFKAEQTKGSAAHRTALAAAVRGEAAVAAGELNRLRALRAPAGDGLVVGKYVEAVASQVQLIDQLAAAVAANDGKRLTAVGDKLAAGKSAVDGLASAYGFKVCGNVAS